MKNCALRLSIKALKHAKVVFLTLSIWIDNPIQKQNFITTLFKENHRKHRVCCDFGVFRFLLTSGTIVQHSSQENEIQNLSQQPHSVPKKLFRHAVSTIKKLCFFVA